MPMVYYEYLFLISDNSDFDMAELVTRLQNTFTNINARVLTSSPSTLQLVITNGKPYRFRLTLNEANHILVESAELAEEATSRQSEIAHCRKRLEMQGEDDPDMNHFNDSMCIIETMESFSGIHVYDPNNGFVTQ